MATEQVDVLLVSAGTTAGWRHSDEELRRTLEELGVRTAVSTSEFRIARHLRRTVLATDLAEAASLRRAHTRTLRTVRAQATIYSSPQAAMLQPRSRLHGATAVRFDAPAALNRRGPGSGLLHALERRALGAVRLLLPLGLEPAASVREALRVETPMTALPIPIDGAGQNASDERGSHVLVYAGNPDKKGLDIALAAWARAAHVTGGRRIVVTGIEPERGKRFIAERGVAEPEGVEWAGFVDPDRYRELLETAEVFLAASRYEDYGIAQLEALARGALLVTVPSDGPYEALTPARRLAPNLVATDVSPQALARSIEAAASMGDIERREYRVTARGMVAPYSRDTLRERLRDEVLPVLLE